MLAKKWDVQMCLGLKEGEVRYTNRYSAKHFCFVSINGPVLLMDPYNPTNHEMLSFLNMLS